jgi:hypothetical protein
MPTFRQRPLTWLFLIATLCLDLVAVAGAANHESEWFGALALGQMYVAGGWLILGRTHRLLRATVFLLTPIVLAAPDFLAAPEFLNDSRDGSFTGIQIVVAPLVLGITIFLTVLAAVMTGLLLVLNALLTWRQGAKCESKWQFPLVELFGWMIVVAVACVISQGADYDHIDQEILWDCLMTVALPAGLMTFFTGDHRKSWFLMTALIGGAILSAFQILRRWESTDAFVVLGAYGFVGVWVLVQSMDEAMRRRSCAVDN